MQQTLWCWELYSVFSLYMAFDSRWHTHTCTHIRPCSQFCH